MLIIDEVKFSKLNIKTFYITLRKDLVNGTESFMIENIIMYIKLIILINFKILDYFDTNGKYCYFYDISYSVYYFNIKLCCLRIK